VGCYPVDFVWKQVKTGAHRNISQPDRRAGIQDDWMRSQPRISSEFGVGRAVEDALPRQGGNGGDQGRRICGRGSP
jgi:hypothetical protein